MDRSLNILVKMIIPINIYIVIDSDEHNYYRESNFSTILKKYRTIM